MFLLPDRGTKSKRRTKTLANTCEPRWGQTFIYTGFRRCDLNGRLLEVVKHSYLRVLNLVIAFKCLMLGYFMGLRKIRCQRFYWRSRH